MPLKSAYFILVLNLIFLIVESNNITDNMLQTMAKVTSM